ncbi:hypothetical protein LTR62_000332 [Meristemomyces frigidus]|uniref:Uncharacterized protein n=1 Tax=Meristemomyces frigidus TaxID=1508187 RepID=A0AAN7TXU1_9PEZI|nr:hypothetical protein LTR62_000332 [Meristemomyces frigidus]
MHWHAIKHTHHYYGKPVSFHQEHANTVNEQHDVGEPGDQDHDHQIAIPVGGDNARDTHDTYNLPSLSNSLQDIHLHDEPITAASTAHTEEEPDNLPISIPSFTTGLVPFAYEQALLNRIQDVKLQPDGEYDTTTYPPTFIHDCLMLPGSLTQLLGKLDTPETVSRMTPALLPGLHAHVHTDTRLPCLLPSQKRTDCVQGMLVFGLGKVSRRLIHQHYRSTCKRVKVEVELDVAVPVLPGERDFTGERWRVVRRKVWADVWLWANDLDFVFKGVVPGGWRIEDYLTGGSGREGGMDVRSPEEWEDVLIEAGEADGQLEGGEAYVVQGTMQPEPKTEVVYGGCASLNYNRESHFTGW